MKHLISLYKILILITLLTTVASCQDFMSTDTDRYMLADDNLINSPNDTVYSVIGILNKVQKISDRYVLLGELRGDLLDITAKTESELSDLSNFVIDTTTSKFSDVKDFYAIINNCNYFIQRADTNIKVGINKPFVKEVAVVKAIRAWTYLQLVLDYGTAYYTDKPILTVAESIKKYPELNLSQMIDTLITQIKDLKPVTNNDIPGFANGDESLFVNPLFLLGDLYLWKASISHDVADYENAALSYARLIRKGYLNNSSTSISWTDDTYKSLHDNWSSIFAGNGSSELISTIRLASDKSKGTIGQINSLAKERKVVPSSYLEALSASQIYCYRDPNATLSTLGKFRSGDLRLGGATDTVLNKDNLLQEKFISKYTSNNVILYREGLLHLRYAEAVNRAGKPGVAFAVLKYGLNKANLSNPAFVSASEIADNKEYVSIFNDPIFDTYTTNKILYELNVGIHNRGCGNSTYNTFYKIPDKKQLDASNLDSITFVENTICDELALETAFEGNRFQDLMRMSSHRNDPSFLAEKVAKKHSDNPGLKAYLSEKKNWFIPVKK